MDSIVLIVTKKKIFPVKRVKIVYGMITAVQRKALLKQDDDIISTWEAPSKRRKTVSSSQGNSPTGVAGQIHHSQQQLNVMPPYGTFCIQEIFDSQFACTISLCQRQTMESQPF